jgi:predicted nucleic acid-binding protein
MPAETPGGLIIAEPSGTYARRPPLVGDCSVLAAVLFDEPRRREAADALAGMEIFAPFLLDHELVSVAVKKAHQGLIDVVRQGLADLAELDITRCAVDAAAQWRVALECQLTAYDAAYLQLALDLQAPLVTFDQRLGQAARRLLGSSSS